MANYLNSNITDISNKLKETNSLKIWCQCYIFSIKGKEQSYFSNNFIVLNHKQICFITIYDGCLT